MASNSSTLSECWRLNQVLCLLREYLKCNFLDPRSAIFLGKKNFFPLFLLFLFLLYLHVPSLHLLFLFSFTLMLLGLLCCWVGKNWRNEKQMALHDKKGSRHSEETSNLWEEEGGFGWGGLQKCGVQCDMGLLEKMKCIRKIFSVG